jgi:hypothetical protein
MPCHAKFVPLTQEKLAECTRDTTVLVGTGLGCVAYWNPPMGRIDHDGAELDPVADYSPVAPSGS